jgi:hypothetical protein
MSGWRYARGYVIGTLSLMAVLLIGCGPNTNQMFGLGGRLINIVEAPATFQLSGSATAKATCPSSQQLLGGGFWLSGEATDPNATTGVVAVAQDYASSIDTWTVQASAPPDATRLQDVVVSAIAYCYAPSSPPLRMKIVSARISTTSSAQFTTTASGTATCPVGGVLTGGGYQVTSADSIEDGFNSYITSNTPVKFPMTDGWTVSLQYPNALSRAPVVKAYALCAGANLQRGSIYTTQAGSALATPATSVSVSCPADFYSTGGGYIYSQTSPGAAIFPYNFLSSYATSAMGWKVQDLGASSQRPIVVRTHMGGWQASYYTGVGWQGQTSAYCLRFPTTP